MRVAIAFSMLICASAFAQTPAVSSRAELLFYDNTTSTWSDSAFNRIAHVPDHSLNLELRPDINIEQDAMTAVLRPRVAARTEPDARHSDAWINEGWLRWRPIEGTSLQLGREALLWGPAAFWNPSNPFFSENNKDNAKREIAGHDFLRARWQWHEAWALSLVSQLDRGHTPSGVQRRDAMKLDWTGNEASAAALLSAEPGKSAGWQGWAQWTASDALIIYGESAWQRPASHAQPYAAMGTTGWQIANTSSPYELNTVAGAAWTFENNWTLNAEWWRNGNGLTHNEASILSQAVDALSTQAPGLADAQLASLIQPTTPLRRHYAGLQLMNGSDAKIGWTLRYKRNLDDRSGEAFVMIKRDLGDTLQLWGNLMLRHGQHDTEYGRWIRSSAMLGVSWFM
ncbi:MAG TPA: hypothetical protein VFW00_05930 [Rhodocyclaceae bacterium]|nr:hypothetical protein [Rhodocyclaceae bacterium]